MKKRLFNRYVLLVLPVVALGTLTGCRKPAEPAAAGATLPTLDVTVTPVTLTTQSATEPAVGSVHPRLQATIEPKVNGRIAQLPVHLGQAVKKGDLIAALDVEEIQAKLDQAQARHQQAQQDLKRFAALLKQEAVTPAEFDGVQARERMTRAAVKEAQTMLDYAQVRAPFDGTITRKFAEVGDMAGPGRPVAGLESAAQHQLVADVPEALINPLHVDQELAVNLPAAGQTVTGKIAEIAPAADPGSRTFRIKINLPATPGLRSGQFGRALIPVAEQAILQVPATAIIERGQLQMAFVATNGVASLRLVKTGRVTEDHAEILAGLKPGEQVIVAPTPQLRDGQPVRPSPGS